MPRAEVLNPCTNRNAKCPKVVSPHFPCQLLHAVSFLRKELFEEIDYKLFRIISHKVQLNGEHIFLDVYSLRVVFYASGNSGQF
jgi:hypothetical protein